MANKTYNMDMTSGPLLKKIIFFAIPLILTSVLQLLYNAADIVVVGKFAGDSSLAAVGSTTSLINLIVNTFAGLSMGSGVIVAQAIGANDSTRIGKTVHTSMLLSVILGVGVGILGICICEPLLLLMGSPKEVLTKATLYMRVYFCGMPGFMIYNFGSVILRSVGDTKRPLAILSISGVANVLLNLLFVIAFKMDVAGVALATIISQYISAIWVVILLIKDKTDCRLFIKKLRIHKAQLINIFAFGMPIGIQNSLFSISNVIIQSSINTFGTVVMAGNSAAINIEGFVHAILCSVSQTAMMFSGQNSGARKYDRVKKVLTRCLLLTTIIGIVLGGMVLIFKESLLFLYTDSANVVNAGAVRLNIIIVFYAIFATMETVACVTRGMGKSLVPMLITMVFVCAMRVVCVFTIFAAFREVEIVYWSYPATWALASIGQFAYFTIVYKASQSIYT